MENLKELSLCISESAVNKTWTIPFTCDNLESLEIAGGKDILTRISNYPNVKKFTFVSRYVNHWEISKVLPLLEEIDLSNYSINLSVDEIVCFVKKFQSLKLLRFRSSSRISIEELMTHFKNSWSVSYKTCNACIFPSKIKKFLSIQLKRC